MLPRFEDFDAETLALVRSLMPMFMQDFIRIIGMEMALALVREFGGTEIIFTEGMRVTVEDSFSLVSAVIGPISTRRLAEEYPCEKIYIPRCLAAMRELRKKEILIAFNAMARVTSVRLTCNELARRYGLSAKAIENIINNKTGEFSQRPGRAGRNRKATT